MPCHCIQGISMAQRLLRRQTFFISRLWLTFPGFTAASQQAASDQSKCRKVFGAVVTTCIYSLESVVTRESLTSLQAWVNGALPINFTATVQRVAQNRKTKKNIRAEKKLRKLNTFTLDVPAKAINCSYEQNQCEPSSTCLCGVLQSNLNS